MSALPWRRWIEANNSVPLRAASSATSSIAVIWAGSTDPSRPFLTTTDSRPALHDEPGRAEDTDWRQILALYALLERLDDSPMVTLNKAVATAMVQGPEAGLALLGRLDDDVRLTRQHRLAAVRGHLLEMAGRFPEAQACYREAARRTTSIPERRHLQARAARL